MGKEKKSISSVRVCKLARATELQNGGKQEEELEEVGRGDKGGGGAHKCSEREEEIAQSQRSRRPES